MNESFRFLGGVGWGLVMDHSVKSRSLSSVEQLGVEISLRYVYSINQWFRIIS